MPISLMIKGTPADADRALRARGFQPEDRLTQPRIIPTRSRHVASIVLVRDVTQPKVLLWFAESDKAVIPYPVGTLLHYRLGAAEPDKNA